MAEQEKMVPLSQAWRMMGTGMQWEAGLFIETYRQLKEKLGRDEAKKILQKSLYDAGARLGKEMAEEVGRTDARGMAQAWELMYGITAGGEGVRFRFVASARAFKKNEPVMLPISSRTERSISSRH